MSIRKMEEYDQHKDEAIGFINFGTDIVGTNSKKYAKEALVFLVVGVNICFKVPVAYFLTAGLKSNEKAALIQEVILLVSKTGIKIVGMTFDGLASNFSTCKILGADFRNNKPYIINPHSDENIYLFLDACHMLKIARNCLAGKKQLFDGDGNCIEWKYIEELEKYQRNNKINLGNKIGKLHIQWEKRKMSVRIAAQTLSNGTADAIEFLCISNVKEFYGCAATVKFIRRINNVFDIMNSKTDSGIGFKRSLSPETKCEYFQYFDESIEYFQNIKLNVNGKSILKTRSKTPFFGFIVDLTNFRELYMKYVESGLLKSVSTFRFSQDHLELLFGCIRQMFGCNDNPSAKQFQSAWRRLLGQHRITASDFANCESNDTEFLTVLNCSSRTKNQNSDILENISPLGDDVCDTQNIDATEREIQSIDSILSEPSLPNEMDSHVIAYVASIMQQNIIEGRWYWRLKCEDCSNAFPEDDLVNDSFLNLKARTNQLSAPAKSTVRICEIAETCMLKYEYKPGTFDTVLHESLQILESENLFPNSNFESHSEDGHKEILISLIIRMFFKKKQNHISHCNTQATHGSFVRNYLLKYLHSQGL